MYTAPIRLLDLVEANVDVGVGAAYGTAKSGIGISGVGTYRPDLIMKVGCRTSSPRAFVDLQLQSLIPVVMSGILAVYALVISVLIASDIRPPPQKSYTLFAGFMHMAAGLSVGLAGMAAGYAIGIVGDVVRLIGRRYGDNVLTCGRVCVHICSSRGSS